MDNYEQFKKSVIHLEGATDSEHYSQIDERISLAQEKLSRGEISPDEFSRAIQRKSRDVRSWGTALFIEHKGKHFLATARHVVHDNYGAKLELEEETKRIEGITNFPEDRKTEDIAYAKERMQERIFPIIFRVPTMEEIFIRRDKKPEFLMNLGAGVYKYGIYTFSDPALDVAVISIENRERRFLEDLLNVGYRPLSSSTIDTSHVTEGQDVFTVGFPYAITTVNKKKNAEPWNSMLTSEPAFSFGKVAMNSRFLSYLWADLSAYPGNSGGPLFSRGKLIGLVSAQAVVSVDSNSENEKTGLSARIPFAKITKAEHLLTILDQQLEKDS